MWANAFIEISPKITSGTNAYSVICGLMRIRSTSATTAVNRPPTSCTSPVPTKLRTPSTSVMMRDTNAPLLLLSKNEIGRRMMCSCICARSTEIKCWASTLKRRVSKYDVSACTRIAPPTTARRIFKSPVSWCAMTLSIRYFVEPGRTKPDSRLIPTSKSPTRTSLRRGHTMVQNVRRTLARETDFLGGLRSDIEFSRKRLF